MGRLVLALIRHGEYAQPAGVPSAHLPYGLTAAGQAQARDAGLAVLEFAGRFELQLHSVIDCSRLRRAWETAALMARAIEERTHRRFTPREHDDLVERSVGAAANLSVEAIEAILRDDPRYSVPMPGWKRDPEYRLPFPGCESLAEAGARVVRHLRCTAAALAGSIDAGPTQASCLKLVVGHGGAFRHAARQLGILTTEQVASLSMTYGVPLYFEVERGGDGADRFVHIAGEWRQRLPGAASD